MHKKLLQKLFNAAGYQLIRLPKQPEQLSIQTTPDDNITLKFIEMISNDPLNPDLHLQYAIEAHKCGLPYLAFSELKTAEFLGARQDKISKYLDIYRKSLPHNIDMNHNQYFRFLSLTSVIQKKNCEGKVSILDIGGGHGELASFIPSHNYCFAEPAINGISGVNLPFPDKTFDYVISCHVLEHIPVDKRKIFLAQILSKSIKGIILLNPFYIRGTHVKERLEVIIDITDATWAKEHLDCTLPELELITDFASENKLTMSVIPSGTLLTSMALELMNYFAIKAGMEEKMKTINRFYNSKYINILDSKDYPTAFIIELDKQNDN